MRRPIWWYPLNVLVTFLILALMTFNLVGLLSPPTFLYHHRHLWRSLKDLWRPLP